VKAHEVVPLRMPRVLPYAVVALIATLSLVIISGWNKPAVASLPDPLDVVVAQAERAKEELAELEEYANKEQDEELKKLVKELAAAIEDLKQPGTDVREAMAKLSEMQAALQAEQAERNPVALDAQFQSIGEALALAESLAEAGQALTAAQYEKAAAELAKAEAPELDRATEKAVKEKLEQAARQAENQGQNSLSKALGEMASGLGNKNSKQFSEGSQKLAGEAKKQGKRKKLNDLLQKQCNCLSECKGECECDNNGKSKSKSNKPGGKNWGLAGSDGELGERTAKLNGKDEKLKGKQSDEGEVETETTHSPEGSQQAQREFRENYQKYKKISEEVLDSEPIPLGHRQTIRRYFESIRPTDAETDATAAPPQATP
jgi:chromosome segregation ATPase